MPYREVTMLETKELLRLWMNGMGIKTIAGFLGLDPKTVRRYIKAGREHGLSPEEGSAALTDDVVVAIMAAFRNVPGRPRGESWDLCRTHRAFIEEHLGNGVRLTKVRKLLHRIGVSIPYGTLHRFASVELEFGRVRVTVPVADCGPGEEIQVDTGWMSMLEPDLFGKRRRFRAWIFTAVLSRHRFVYPCFAESTATAIEACEAAWEYFGGVFKVLIPDNTKAIVDRADPLHPRIVPAFLEYAQARGFHVDPTRVRQPTDKGRVERSVPTVRDDCFGGERLRTIEQARDLARNWGLTEYGTRRHSRTHRLPREQFEAEEKPVLLPAPLEPYDVPIWADPLVARDHCAQVAKALYTLPTEFIGKKLRARADSSLVRFYHAGTLVKTHPRQPPGGKSIDPADFPKEKTAYALRDVEFLKRQADGHGEAVGRFARSLLDSPLPWTRMRRVYALLGLVRKYGAERVATACETALTYEMSDVKRLERMILAAHPDPGPTTPGRIIPLARYLRPAGHYALQRNPQPKGDPHDHGSDLA
jgi:transposase